MITVQSNQPPPEQQPEFDDELRQHGIRRVRVDSFEVNGYRYTNARDAIEEAKRHPGHAS